MSLTLRVILLVGALCTLFYLFWQIRRSKMLISHTVFWSFFAIGLVVLGGVPQIAVWAANVVGIESPANFVFLIIIFLIIIKQFTSTVKISRLEEKVIELTEYIALHEAEQNKM